MVNSNVKEYTDWEGSIWRRWLMGNVNEFSLAHKLSLAKLHNYNTVWVNGMKVHSLKFQDGRQWDCINGWRTIVHGVDITKTAI